MIAADTSTWMLSFKVSPVKMSSYSTGRLKTGRFLWLRLF